VGYFKWERSRKTIWIWSFPRTRETFIPRKAYHLSDIIFTHCVGVGYYIYALCGLHVTRIVHQGSATLIKKNTCWTYAMVGLWQFWLPNAFQKRVKVKSWDRRQMSSFSSDFPFLTLDKFRDLTCRSTSAKASSALYTREHTDKDSSLYILSESFAIQLRVVVGLSSYNSSYGLVLPVRKRSTIICVLRTYCIYYVVPQMRSPFTNGIKYMYFVEDAALSRKPFFECTSL
jgi:hypothetical protein